MGESPKLIFVYLGSRIPKYAKLNLKQIHKSFPEVEMFLISDDERNRGAVQGVSFYKTQKMSELWPEVYKKMSHDLVFRNGFWFSSIARFMAIREFLATGVEGPFIHLELDVLLSPEFPINLFRSVEEDLAFTLASPSEGSAAVLYIKSLSSINSLVSISEDIFSHSPGSTDMTILREIFDKKLMSTLILPSTPKDSCQDGNMWGSFIFDPSSWGMYLLGQDPRNHRGKLIFNRSERHHFIHPDDFTFGFQFGKLSVRTNSRKSQIVNLHVHSKDLRAFRAPEKYIAYRTHRASEPEYSEFDLVIFLNLLSKKLRKVLFTLPLQRLYKR